MRISTSGAVLVAGVLVLAGFLFHAAFPRYEMKTLADGSLIRIDRWTAQSAFASDRDVPDWAATVARSPWAHVSSVGLLEGTVLLAAGSGLAGWRARRAWRVARVRRRLQAMVASDAAWPQRI
jgi:hypothetical protein